MLEVEGLCKRYGNFDAVKDLSFKIETGGIYGFLGPNGAGKSTTMNMITGYLAPTSGRVLIDGSDITKEPIKAKKKLGYLPEVPPLYPDLTVKEYLGFVSELKGVPSAGRKSAVKEIMERTGLDQAGGKLIRNLSKGYKQRTGIAAAIIGYPDLIILDEPTSGLDPAQIIEIRELIRSLKDDHTVILSSHILQEISALCDHIMVISHGRLKANDTPENIAASMNTENRLSLLIKGGEEGLRETLTSASFIRSFTLEEEEGLIKAVLISSAGEDIREEVFDLIKNGGFKIFDMRSKHMSLEDVYMKLTSDDYEEVKEESEADTNSEAGTEIKEGSGEENDMGSGEEGGDME